MISFLKGTVEKLGSRFVLIGSSLLGNDSVCSAVTYVVGVTSFDTDIDCLAMGIMPRQQFFIQLIPALSGNPRITNIKVH